MIWAEEDFACIASLSTRCPGALDIGLAQVQKLLADPRLLQVVPYTRSRMRAAASSATGRVRSGCW